MNKVLVIQTAFIGDVVLATAIVEKLALKSPGCTIDFLVRQGNQSLLLNNPHIHEVLVWNKKEHKTRNLLALLSTIRKNKYDTVINLQRFFATGLLTGFSGAKQRIGFDKNPLSFLFTHKFPHIISDQTGTKHEVDRNNDLIAGFTDKQTVRPRLYPSADDYNHIQPLTEKPYITMTPGSVWFTKKYPLEKWIELLDALPGNYHVYLLGGKENTDECETILARTTNRKITNLAGKLSFLQSAALMKTATMNYVNDSAPLHFASAMNAPVTAIFCSTVPAFGFTPLSDQSYIIETREKLLCRPCGLHGKKACPEKHFRCGTGIQVSQLLATLPQ